MKVLQVGSKNYPPAHGGVEKVIYDITNDNDQIESYILTEWNNSEKLFNVETLPEGFLKKFSFILKYVKKNSINTINFHKETYSVFAMYFSLIGYDTILTFHGLAWRISRWNILYRFIFFVMDFFACLIVKKIVFVSENDRNTYKRIFFWKDFRFIPNGVYCGDEEELESNKERLNSLCYLGRISPEKNILNLIKAANKQKLYLDLFGPFDLRDIQFKNEVLKYTDGSKYVNWKGRVSSDKVYDILKNYNAFINPSFSEGMPVSVLEAAANGCYLVLSDINQHKNLNFPEVFYIDCKNIDLKGLRLNRISPNNFIHVKKHYSLGIMKENYLKLYTNEGR